MNWRPYLLYSIEKRLPPDLSPIFYLCKRPTAESCFKRTMVQSVFLFPMLFAVQVFSQSTTAPALSAALYGLSTITTLPFPEATRSSIQSFYQFQTGPPQGPHIEWRAQPRLHQRPLPNAPTPGSTSNSSAHVLQVQYPADSYQDNNVGGAQF